MSKNGGEEIWNTVEKTKCYGRKQYEQRKKACNNS